MIYKAQKIGERITPDLLIKATEELPNLNRPDRLRGRLWLARNQNRFDAQAREIAEALYTSLPGGTIHALLVEMLRRHENLLHVTWGGENED